jgi:hypothetical protein
VIFALSGKSSGVTMSRTDNSVIPFAPTGKGNEQLDKAGQSILQLLHKAAGEAEENSRHTLGIADKLSHQLRAAEQRITDLEAEVERHRYRAERAEQWLNTVYVEIEERFTPQASGRPRTTAR